MSDCLNLFSTLLCAAIVSWCQLMTSILLLHTSLFVSISKSLILSLANLLDAKLISLSYWSQFLNDLLVETLGVVPRSPVSKATSQQSKIWQRFIPVNRYCYRFYWDVQLSPSGTVYEFCLNILVSTGCPRQKFLCSV